MPQILHNVIEAQFPKGQVEVLSDQSGHYQPDMSMTGQTVNQLEKKGVEVEKLTVNLGSKGYGQEELRLPATGVQGFVDFGHDETQLREFDSNKQSMYEELRHKMGTGPKPSNTYNSEDYKQAPTTKQDPIQGYDITPDINEDSQNHVQAPATKQDIESVKPESSHEKGDGVTHWSKYDQRQSTAETRDQSVQLTSLEKRLDTVKQTIQETELDLTSNPGLSKTQKQDLQQVLHLAKPDQKIIESQIQKLTQKSEPEVIIQSFKAPNVLQPLEGLIADCIRQQEKDLTKAILPSSKREVLQTAQDNVKKMFENASSDSDLLLHLATKSESDLYVDTIKSMGLLKVKYGEELTLIISKFENDKTTYIKTICPRLRPESVS